MNQTQQDQKPFWEKLSITIPVFLALIAGAFSFGLYVEKTNCNKETAYLITENETNKQKTKIPGRVCRKGQLECGLLTSEISHQEKSLETARNKLVSLRSNQNKTRNNYKQIIDSEVDSILAVQGIWLLNSILQKANCK